MTEYKLFEGESYVSTFEFHEHRERAPHLEQMGHRARLHQAADFVKEAARFDGEAVSVSDLGCGDGGLLSLLKDSPQVSRAWGYDFAPANVAGWAERGVTATLWDVFNYTGEENPVEFGRVSVTTEVLEHLVDPHGVVAGLAEVSNYLVASSPYDESDVSHDECHSWAWDMDGYRAMVEAGGWSVIQHTAVDSKFQVLLAVRV